MTHGQNPAENVPPHEPDPDTERARVMQRCASLLARLQWAGSVMGDDACPYCYAPADGDEHAEDCELADCLSDLWEWT